MTNLIEISGKDDKGPWTVKRIETGIRGVTEAYRFGGLVDDIITSIKGRNVIYDIDYKGSHGRIFEDPEERVIFHIIDTHNQLVDIVNSTKDLI